MKFREVFGFEFTYRLRRLSTWMYAAMLFVPSLTFIPANAEAAAAVKANSPDNLAEPFMAIGMLGIAVSAALFGGAAVRDIQSRMDPLLFTTSLRKIEYLGGRFLAALTVNAIVLLAIPLGLMAGTLLPNVDPAALGPFRLAAYVQPFVLFVLPNTIFAGALLFTTGVLSRQIVPVYLCAIGIVISFLIASSTMEAVSNPTLAMIGDPLCVRLVDDIRRYWTAAERNVRLIGFPAILLWNRVLWLSIAAATLLVLHVRFQFAHPGGGRRTREPRRATAEVESRPLAPVAVPRVTGSFGFHTALWQTLAVARNLLAEAFANRWFAVVMLMCTGLSMLWGWNVVDTLFETTTWPVTFLIAEELLSNRVVPMIYMLTVVFAGELVSKEREVGIAEMAHAAPVPDGAALGGRFLALVVILVMILTACTIGGILIQALQGYYDFEIGLYLRVVFGLNLPVYMILGALAMTIHVLVNHKYLGHIVALMALLAPKLAPQLLGIRHNLLLYGNRPDWTYSDMNGFGPFLGPVVWFTLYWAAWALLLLTIATALLVRGREPGVGHRLRVARERLGGLKPAGYGWPGRTAGVAVLLILGVGGFIFYNTNVLNEYVTAEQSGARSAEYEKRYGRYKDAPQPTITAADLNVEIYPEAPAIDIRGTYHLVNRTSSAIDSVHVFVKPEIVTRSISFDRAVSAALTDEYVGYRIYTLERPLEPGASLDLTFDVAFRPRGFPNDDIQTDVVRNGAYFNREWTPIVGYQPVFELSDAESRARLGLEPRPPTPRPGDAVSRRYRQTIRDADLVQVKAVIGTSAGQTAVTPGVLRRSWTENGRRYFHYETEQPTGFGASVFSAGYATVEDRWKDVALSILHHPSHTYDLSQMFRGMKAALEYFTTVFGPYWGSQLRIVEIPRYGRFGRAHPQTIAFTEDNFITRGDAGDFDKTFFGTAHEVAHMWWGGQVRSAAGVLGQGFLSESLANYSAMMVTEKTYGLEAARRVYAFQMDRYLRQRANNARDVPLLETEDQPWIYYGKGAVALYLLRDCIGAEAVNTALRRYLEKNREGRPPYPTSLDLYAELAAVTPGQFRYLLTDLFETVTVWDVRATRVHVEPTGTGEYRVTLNVVAKKMRADSVGNETETPMDDLVEIGIFAPGVAPGVAPGLAPGVAGGLQPAGSEHDERGETLYLNRHRIRSGEQTITVTVPKRPGRAGIDPHHKLIDRQPSNNVIEVDTAR